MFLGNVSKKIRMGRNTIRLQPLMNIQENEYRLLLMKKSITHTSEFLLTLESKMGFKISTVKQIMSRKYNETLLNTFLY